MARRRKPKPGPYISTKRAKKRPGKTVKVGGVQVIKKRGKKPIAFKKGALHKALGVPQGQRIPKELKEAALRGDFGPKVKKQAVFAFKGPLAAGRKKRKRKRAS